MLINVITFNPKLATVQYTYTLFSSCCEIKRKHRNVLQEARDICTSYLCFA